MSSSLPQQSVFLSPDTLVQAGDYAQRHDIPLAGVLRLAIMHGLANPEVFSRAPSKGRSERVWCYVQPEIKSELKRLGYKLSKPASALMAAAIESFMAGLLAEEDGTPTRELKRTWQALHEAHPSAV